MSAKIPATVITGFLGAGKTSLIQNLLRTGFACLRNLHRFIPAVTVC